MWLRLALVMSSLVLPAPSLAEEARTYGVAAKTYVALTPWDVRPFRSTVTYDITNSAFGPALHVTSAGGGGLVAPLHLPNGALVTEVEAVFCDTNPFERLLSNFVVRPRVGATTQLLTPSSSNAETPGCVDRTVTLSPPIQIDNNANSYWVQVAMTAGDSSISLGSVRVAYVLQVSAPGAQVFNDVPPSHLFFQFIQALAAAGITGGCSTSPPLYCPDDFITRGQMAVFLSRALGLHFAPP